jgi:hypothetical protein
MREGCRGCSCIDGSLSPGFTASEIEERDELISESKVREKVEQVRDFERQGSKRILG